jgi:hypothetical protein
MSNVSVHTLNLDLNWELITLLSEIDRFDAAWTAIERREGHEKSLIVNTPDSLIAFKQAVFITYKQYLMH